MAKRENIIVAAVIPANTLMENIKIEYRIVKEGDLYQGYFKQYSRKFTLNASSKTKDQALYQMARFLKFMLEDRGIM